MAKKINIQLAEATGELRLTPQSGVSYPLKSIRNAVRKHARGLKSTEKELEFWAVMNKSKSDDSAVFQLEVWPFTAGKQNHEKSRLATLDVRFVLRGDAWHPVGVVAFDGHGAILRRMVGYLERGLPRPPVGESRVFEVLVG